MTPRRNIDVLKEALAAKKRGQLYSIAFIGVNGVGKSTSLAKTAYYLKQKGNLNVMLAGCDNFRSGAIEQLKTHAMCLDIPLYEKGYKDDAAVIAKEALIEAKNKGYDVVLIDTAGRMQGNEKLMKQLAKLVHLNQPDVVLFVGEALVGNDAID
jgi:signal recognition particle receptor subunit alpha